LEILLDWAPPLVVLVASLLTLLVLKQVSKKSYAVRDHDIAYRSGLFWRKTVLLAFDRVQHIEVSSGPLQRQFGLASIKFFTAGGASVDLKIDGLVAADAERLREFILTRSAADDGG
jgi:membrane protein YdbS with pleckstrin-like domain